MTIQELVILILGTTIGLAYVNVAWRLRPLGYGLELWVFLVLASAAAAAGPLTRLGSLCVVGAACVVAAKGAEYVRSAWSAKEATQADEQLLRDRVRMVEWFKNEVQEAATQGLIAIVPRHRGPFAVLEFEIVSLRPLYESDDAFTEFEHQVETFIEMVHSTLGAVARRGVESKRNLIGDLLAMRQDEVFAAALLTDGRWVMISHRRATEKRIREIGSMDIPKVKQAMLRAHLVDLFTMSVWRPSGYDSASDGRILTVGSIERLEDLRKRSERTQTRNA